MTNSSFVRTILCSDNKIKTLEEKDGAAVYLLDKPSVNRTLKNG